MNSSQFIVISRLFALFIFAKAFGSFPWSLVSGYSGMTVAQVGLLLLNFSAVALLPSLLLWCLAPWLATQAFKQSDTLIASASPISAYDVANVALFLFGLYWIASYLLYMPFDILSLASIPQGLSADEALHPSSSLRLQITTHVLQVLIGGLCLFGSKRIAKFLTK